MSPGASQPRIAVAPTITTSLSTSRPNGEVVAIGGGGGAVSGGPIHGDRIGRIGLIDGDREAEGGGAAVDLGLGDVVDGEVDLVVVCNRANASIGISD